MAVQCSGRSTQSGSTVESFGFILGVQRRTFRDQDPPNIEAAELVERLHDALADAGHRGHNLERFLVRMVFCMFGDDTGVCIRETAAAGPFPRLRPAAGKRDRPQAGVRSM